jgi:Skp family chaperone for outer membrane proteins
MKKTAALIAVLLLSAPARAIELSLEENRGERGSVGYVDMQRLFTASPDAQRAKESFEDLVRQAEERVNLRKAELLKLRQALDSTRVERDALAQSMLLAAAAAPAPTVALSTPAVAVSTPAAAPGAVAVSTPAAASSALSPAAAALLTAPIAPVKIAVSTSAAAAPRPRELALPGMSTTDAAPSAPPAAAAAPAAQTAAPATVAVSTRAAAQAAAPAVSTAAVAAAAAMFPAPGPAPFVAQSPTGPTPAQRLLELDAKIIDLQADIAHKESDLAHEHDDADRGLLDVESRKTDQVLARLYRAVSEVARREGVSVVIDKTTILYGHQAVDLTDKVLKYLKETSTP